jgi:dihydrofolate reductase
VARHGAIGRNNELLCRISEDLKFFKRTTLGSPVIMGRKTWDSIGRPLPGRRNIVITRNPEWKAEGAERAASVQDAMAKVQDAAKVFVIGGGEIYAQTIDRADRLWLTEVDAALARADAWFPEFDRARWRETRREHHAADARHAFAFDFVLWERP